MKVLVSDGMEESGVDYFRQNGIEIDLRRKTLEILLGCIGEYDGLIVRSSTNVDRNLVYRGAEGNLKVIGRAGVGYDNIDVDAATEKGIVVKFAPYGNTESTAELAFGLMLAVSRNIPQAHYSLRNGVWRRKPFSGSELSRKTLGIIGCGRVGQRLSEIVMGMDMETIGYDINPSLNSHITYLPKDEVLANSDFVSLHVNSNGVVIGEREITMMKPSAYLINTSRGCVLDEEALYQALLDKRIAGVALDVFSSEPKEDGEFSNKFASLENVVLTPHLGASTSESQARTSLEIARVVSGFLLRGSFENSVNIGETLDSEQRKVYPIFIYHKDIPGAFATIDQILADSGVNIRETPSRQIGKQGNVISVYLVHDEITDEMIRRIESLPIVYRISK